MLLCALTLGAGYANKVRCVGPSFDSPGRSEPDYGDRIARDVCYSDIQYLWIGRDIDRHVFPYVNGGYNAGHRAAVRRRRRVPGADRDGHLPGGDAVIDRR